MTFEPVQPGEAREGAMQRQDTPRCTRRGLQEASVAELHEDTG